MANDWLESEAAFIYSPNMPFLLSFSIFHSFFGFYSFCYRLFFSLSLSLCSVFLSSSPLITFSIISWRKLRCWDPSTTQQPPPPLHTTSMCVSQLRNDISTILRQFIVKYYRAYKKKKPCRDVWGMRTAEVKRRERERAEASRKTVRVLWFPLWYRSC